MEARLAGSPSPVGRIEGGRVAEMKRLELRRQGGQAEARRERTRSPTARAERKLERSRPVSIVTQSLSPGERVGGGVGLQGSLERRTPHPFLSLQGGGADPARSLTLERPRILREKSGRSAVEGFDEALGECAAAGRRPVPVLRA